MSQTKAQLISDLVQALNFTGTASAPANGLFLSAANTLKLATASTERLKIDGTELVVNDTGANVDLRVEGDTEANLLFVDASADKVGIGTSSPNYLLDVEAASGDSQMRLSSVGTGSGDDTLLRLQIGGTSANNYIYFGDNDDSNTGQIRYSHGSNFLSVHTNASEALRIDSSGRVGINETSPETLLHISNGDANDGPIILIEGSGQNAANNLLGGINFKNLDSSGDGPTVTGAIRHKTANSSGNGGYLTFHTHDGTEGGEGSDAVERMRIDADGDVLVGLTTALSTQAGSIQAAGPIIAKSYINAHTSNATVIEYNSNVSKIRAYGATSGSGVLAFSTGGGGDATDSEKMRIDSSGRVGINDSSPSKTLDITGEGGGNGEIHVKRTSGATCNVQAQAAVAVFGSASNHPMQLKSNGTTAVTIDTSQRVGIGTSSPGALLHVDSDTATAGIRVSGDGNSFLELDADSSIAGTQISFIDFKLAGTVEANIAVNESVSGNPLELNSATDHDIAMATGGGHVGIGVTPATILHVKADVGDMLRLDRDNSGPVGNQIAFRHKNSIGNLVETCSINAVASTNAADGNLRFHTKTSGGSNTEKLRITEAGNVGIGATSPVGRLHVHNAGTGSGDHAYAFFTTGDTGATASDGLTIGVAATEVATINYREAGDLSIGTSSTERMRIKSDGKVGIGTSNAQALKLHLYDSTDTSSSREQFRISGGDRTADSFETGFRFFTLSPSANGNRHYRLTADGNIGLTIQGHETSTGNAASDRAILLNPSGGAARFGTSSNISGENFTFFRQESDGAILAAFHQAASADVNGIYMRHGRGLSGFSGKMISFRRNDGTEVGSVSIGASSTAFNTSSDYRLKENVTPISDGITRLKTLKPYRFNFKDDTTKPVVDGFFAHEVTAVPEAITGTKDEVDSDNNPVYQSIDQSKLVPLLVAAVQELIGRVEILEAA